jgi:hypothetical protein
MATPCMDAAEEIGLGARQAKDIRLTEIAL